MLYLPGWACFGTNAAMISAFSATVLVVACSPRLAIEPLSLRRWQSQGIWRGTTRRARIDSALSPLALRPRRTEGTHPQRRRSAGLHHRFHRNRIFRGLFSAWRFPAGYRGDFRRGRRVATALAAGAGHGLCDRWGPDRILDRTFGGSRALSEGRLLLLSPQPPAAGAQV